MRLERRDALEDKAKIHNPLGRGLSPAAGTAQTALRRKTMEKSHSPRAGERVRRGGLGNPFLSPLLPHPRREQGRSGAEQHRVVCAPSAGPAAAPHAGRGPALPGAPPLQRRQRRGSAGSARAAPPGKAEHPRRSPRRAAAGAANVAAKGGGGWEPWARTPCIPRIQAF